MADVNGEVIQRNLIGIAQKVADEARFRVVKVWGKIGAYMILTRTGMMRVPLAMLTVRGASYTEAIDLFEHRLFEEVARFRHPLRRNAEIYERELLVGTEIEYRELEGEEKPLEVGLEVGILIAERAAFGTLTIPGKPMTVTTGDLEGVTLGFPTNYLVQYRYLGDLDEDTLEFAVPIVEGPLVVTDHAFSNEIL